MVEKAKKEKRRKILVTGSSGMLGTDLCQELSDGYEIIGLDLFQLSAFLPAGKASSFQLSAFIQCDITNRDKTVKSIVSAKPDLVIHTAAWTDVDGCEKEAEKAKEINEEGTRNVAISVSELNIPLVYVSTDFIFSGNKKTPYTENDLPEPLNVYARTKLEGEKITEALEKFIILRSGWLYGANGKNFVSAILEQAKDGKELKVVDDQIGCPTYTKDLARAIKRLLEVIGISGYQDIGGIFHISNKGEVSWFEYAEEVLKLTGIKNVKLVPITSKELNRPAKRPAFSVLDNTKFEKLTGFTMRNWQEALKEYFNER